MRNDHILYTPGYGIPPHDVPLCIIYHKIAAIVRPFVLTHRACRNLASSRLPPKAFYRRRLHNWDLSVSGNQDTPAKSGPRSRRTLLETKEKTSQEFISRAVYEVPPGRKMAPTGSRLKTNQVVHESRRRKWINLGDNHASYQ